MKFSNKDHLLQRPPQLPRPPPAGRSSLPPLRRQRPPRSGVVVAKRVRVDDSSLGARHGVGDFGGTSPKMNKCHCPLKKIKVERNSSSNHHFSGDMLVCGGVSFSIDLVALWFFAKSSEFTKSEFLEILHVNHNIQ